MVDIIRSSGGDEFTKRIVSWFAASAEYGRE